MRPTSKKTKMPANRKTRPSRPVGPDVRAYDEHSAVDETLRDLVARSAKLGDELAVLIAAQDKLLLFLKKRRAAANAQVEVAV